jgi:hypothetical protein
MMAAEIPTIRRVLRLQLLGLSLPFRGLVSSRSGSAGEARTALDVGSAERFSI